MVTIVDYWGEEREFDPAQYAKEEYRYPNGDFKFPCGNRSLQMLDLKKCLLKNLGEKH